MSILLTSCHHPALVFCQPLRRFLEGLFALTVLTGRPQHLGRGTGPWPTHTTKIKSFEINQFTKREIFLIQFFYISIFTLQDLPCGHKVAMPPEWERCPAEVSSPQSRYSEDLSGVKASFICLSHRLQSHPMSQPARPTFLKVKLAVIAYKHHNL